MKMKFCLFLFILALAGCSSPGIIALKKNENIVVQPTDKGGLIFIYRDKLIAGSVRGIYIAVNGKRAGGLNSGTYFVYQAPPGNIEIAAEDLLNPAESIKRNLNIETGKKYYIRGSFKGGLWDVIPSIEIVHELEGSEAVRSLSYETLE